jgi:hypothetical protein
MSLLPLELSFVIWFSWGRLYRVILRGWVSFHIRSIGGWLVELLRYRLDTTGWCRRRGPPNPCLRCISLPVSGFLRFPSSWKKLMSENRDMTLSWRGGERLKMHKIWSESDKYRVSYTSRSSVSFVRWPGTWRQADVSWRQQLSWSVSHRVDSLWSGLCASI